MDNTKLVARELAEIADRLRVLATSLEQQAPVAKVVPQMPEVAQQRYDKGECLRCSRPKDDVPGQFRRGLCPSCRTYVSNQIKTGTHTETDFILVGLLAPEASQMRSKELDQLLDAARKQFDSGSEHKRGPRKRGRPRKKK